MRAIVDHLPLRHRLPTSIVNDFFFFVKISNFGQHSNTNNIIIKPHKILINIETTYKVNAMENPLACHLKKSHKTTAQIFINITFLTLTFQL